MDALDALAIGLHYRNTAPANDPVRQITDHRLMELIEHGLNNRRTIRGLDRRPDKATQCPSKPTWTNSFTLSQKT